MRVIFFIFFLILLSCSKDINEKRTFKININDNLTFNEFKNELNKTNADKAIRHDWATHIKHPSLGALKVESHSLDEQGIIEEYYIIIEGEEYAISAEQVKVTKMESHGHSPKPKKKKK